jgi:hypothetical protein
MALAENKAVAQRRLRTAKNKVVRMSATEKSPPI